MDDAPEKERREIPEPAPVVVGGMRYEAVPWGRMRGLGQNGGYLAAYDVASGRELWLFKVYDVKYRPEMEEDKQDVFIEDLALDAQGRLRVTDERGEVYRVDLAQPALLADSED
ncbi:MAG: hypothetical protein RKP46_19105 [Candidatus Accumulibacter sp.]|uniref:hypothetical protein n=1 Tax=Accumulibacter sp. TaxID=2053492 RepID=UPI002878B449|nr:hypothetical protein [Accumulibacter sp.]MDS4016443.1 hypothetical protein [Accumulibacter sp.]